MATFHFDTSAIVKLYRREAGSPVVERIFGFEEHGLSVSLWTVLEFSVVFAVRLRRKELSREAFNMVISRFLRDVLDRFSVIGVDDALVMSSLPLAVKYGMPSADCFQLACTLRVGSASKGRLVFVCSDRELVEAAKREGLDVVDPEKDDAMDRLREFGVEST